MNKIICTLCLLVLSLFLTYCNGSNDNDTNTAESFENQQDIVQYKTYSLDEIYANGVFDENLITPAYKRTRIFPTRDVTYSFFTHWNRIYVSPNDHISVSYTHLTTNKYHWILKRLDLETNKITIIGD